MTHIAALSPTASSVRGACKSSRRCAGVRPEPPPFVPFGNFRAARISSSEVKGTCVGGVPLLLQWGGGRYGPRRVLAGGVVTEDLDNLRC